MKIQITALVTAAVAAIAGAHAAELAVRLADINPGGGTSDPKYFRVFGGNLYFSANDGTSGRELWRYDGTTVQRVADINPGAGSSNPSHLVVFASELLFRADDGTSGQELWRYDGATASRVADIRTGTAGSAPLRLTPFGAELVFTAIGDTTGRELWRYTGATTQRIADINPGGGDGVPHGCASLKPFGSELMFCGDDGSTGLEPWRYNGTGVARLIDMAPGAASSKPRGFTVFGSELLFATGGTASSPAHEMWSYDGVEVSLVAGVKASDMTPFGGELIFQGHERPGGAWGIGEELWRYDGNTASLIEDKWPGPGSFHPDSLTVLNNEVIFGAQTLLDGWELWRYTTDGGISRVADINSGPGGSGPQYFREFHSTLVFLAYGDATTGFEPWLYDGTTVTQVADINPGSAHSLVGPGGLGFNGFTVFGEELVFAANDGTSGKELWALVLETMDDFDGDGIPDPIDSDDDNDGLLDVDEADVGGDPFDPDTDDDGVIHGLDRDPGDATNVLATCTSPDAILNIAISAPPMTCAATDSITTIPTAGVTSTGDLLMISPKVTFGAGFSVESNGKLTVISKDPTAH